MAASKNFVIERGKTFNQSLRWENAGKIVYKSISAVVNTAPMRLTVPLHGVPDGWRGAVTGHPSIDTEENNVRDKDYHELSVIDANTIEINNINATSFKPYVSGGFLQYNEPIDLTGYTARMAVKNKVGGDVLLSLTTVNGGIVVDEAADKITLLISATDTAALTWSKGVYDLEMVSPGGVVSALLTGTVTVKAEVTT